MSWKNKLKSFSMFTTECLSVHSHTYSVFIVHANCEGICDELNVHIHVYECL